MPQGPPDSGHVHMSDCTVGLEGARDLRPAFINTLFIVICQFIDEFVCNTNKNIENMQQCIVLSNEV